MIAQIKGTIIHQSLNFLVIEAQGLGYKVFVSAQTLSQTKKNTSISLFTYLSVKENALELYGFLKKAELEIFELLISVSGIGPKGAQAILTQASPAKIRSSIASSDYSVLTKVSGIGKKTAQRIVLELKNKVGFLNKASTAASQSAASDLETMDALLALGYNQRQAQSALKQINPKLKNTNDKLKAALKILAK